MAQLDNNISTTTTTTLKGSHLSEKERAQIEILHNEGYSNRAIARKLNRNHQTINNEIKHGTTCQVRRQKSRKGKVYTYFSTIYSCDAGQARYNRNRLNSGRRGKYLLMNEFIKELDNLLLGRYDGFKYAPYGALKKLKPKFKDLDLPCVTTIYNWIDAGITETKSIDLVKKPKLRPKKVKQAAQKRCFGKSIDERPIEANLRSEIGHFEIDTIQGKKTASDKVILVLTDRKSRYNITKVINSKTSQDVNKAILELKDEYGSRLFKTITADNGSEFSELSKVHSEVYYAHPYSPWQRGSNENNNGFLRRVITKGKAISSFSEEEIYYVNDIMNEYPRRILNGLSAEEVFHIHYVLPGGPRVA